MLGGREGLGGGFRWLKNSKNPWLGSDKNEIDMKTIPPGKSFSSFFRIDLMEKTLVVGYINGFIVPSFMG